MSAVTIVFAVLQLISGLALTVIVLMQSGKSAGLSGAISGGAETFFIQRESQDAGCEACQGDKVVRACVCRSDAGFEPGWLISPEKNPRQSSFSCRGFFLFLPAQAFSGISSFMPAYTFFALLMPFSSAMTLTDVP